MVRRRCQRCGAWDEDDSLRCQECGGLLVAGRKVSLDQLGLVVGMGCLLALTGYVGLILAASGTSWAVGVGALFLGLAVVGGSYLVRRWFKNRTVKGRIEELDLSKLTEDEEEEEAEKSFTQRCADCGAYSEDGCLACQECGGRFATNGVDVRTLTVVFFLLLPVVVLLCLGLALKVAFDPKFVDAETRVPLGVLFSVLTFVLLFGGMLLIWRLWFRKRRRRQQVPRDEGG
jgi:hypothetical protein